MASRQIQIFTSASLTGFADTLGKVKKEYNFHFVVRKVGMLENLKKQISPLYLVSLIAVLLLAVAATNDQVTQSVTGAFSGITSLDSGAAPTPETNAEQTNTVDLQQGLQGYWGFDSPQVSRGNSLEFDGNDDYVSVPDDPSFSVSEFSISAWVKINSTDNYGIVSNYGSGDHYGIRYDADTGKPVPHLYYDDGGTSGYGFTILYGSSNISDGQWHHITGTWNGKTGETAIYVD